MKIGWSQMQSQEAEWVQVSDIYCWASSQVRRRRGSKPVKQIQSLMNQAKVQNRMSNTREKKKAHHGTRQTTKKERGAWT